MMEPEDGASDGYSQAKLLEVIGITSASWGDYRVWGAIYSHRQACVRYVKREVFRLLDDPSMTRRRLKRELATIAKRVEEYGP